MYNYNWLNLSQFKMDAKTNQNKRPIAQLILEKSS